MYMYNYCIYMYMYMYTVHTVYMYFIYHKVSGQYWLNIHCTCTVRVMHTVY